MLLRISGSFEGIRKYLETGQMQGREKTRDELDERMILAGSLDLLDAVIAQKQGKGDRYLHITLSFLEDHIPDKTLEAIVERFERFAFAAFRRDEYFFYAEAHLPRTKTQVDKRTGAALTRKPHIHIVIPKVNLLSGRYLEPFGRVTHNIRYLDAWQEEVNREFGLASPKDHPRIAMTSRSDVISRYSGDTFAVPNRDVKQSLLRDILTKDIRSLEALEAHCQSLGDIRIRNAGTQRAYVNLRLEGEEKGINLKEYVFSPSFLTLSLKEKSDQLAKPSEDGYVEAELPRSPKESDSELVKEWMTIRAREVRWLHTSGKAEYRRYQESSRGGREAILAKRERAFYEGLARSEKVALDENVCPGQMGVHEQPVLPVTATSRVKVAQSDDKEPEELHPTSVATDFVRRRQETAAMEKGSKNELVHEAKRNIEVNRLFQELTKRKGLEVGKYSVEAGADGLPRIVCGTRRYGVADYLTKEMHFPWQEAADLLCTVYARQVREREDGNTVKAARWKAFEEMANAELEARRFERETAWKESRERFNEARHAYQARKSEIYKDRTLTKRERAHSLSTVRMEYLATQEHIRLLDRTTIRQLSEREHRSLPEMVEPNFPTSVQRNGGDYQVQESSGHEESPIFVCGFVGISVQSAPRKPFIFAGLVSRFGSDGSVDYLKDGTPLIRDTAKTVWVYRETPEAVEAGLRMALLKFGPNLHITGPDSFKELVVKACVDLRLTIHFDEPEIQAKLESTRNASVHQHPETLIITNATKTIDHNGSSATKPLHMRRSAGKGKTRQSDGWEY